MSCDTCGALKDHAPNCKEMTPDDIAQQASQYYAAWLREHELRMKQGDRLRDLVTFWQGKFAIMKLENNRLRRKCRKAGLFK